jgi:hypothetical protein
LLTKGKWREGLSVAEESDVESIAQKHQMSTYYWDTQRIHGPFSLNRMWWLHISLLQYYFLPCELWSIGTLNRLLKPNGLQFSAKRVVLAWVGENCLLPWFIIIDCCMFLSLPERLLGEDDTRSLKVGVDCL